MAKKQSKKGGGLLSGMEFTTLGERGSLDVKGILPSHVANNPATLRKIGGTPPGNGPFDCRYNEDADSVSRNSDWFTGKMPGMQDTSNVTSVNKSEPKL